MMEMPDMTIQRKKMRADGLATNAIAQGERAAFKSDQTVQCTKGVTTALTSLRRKIEPGGSEPAVLTKAGQTSDGMDGLVGSATVGADIRQQAADNPQPIPELAACPPKTTKASQLLALLSRPNGATLQDLTTATGWQQHSVRAGMTGLRKQGHAITRTRKEGLTRFAIAGDGIMVQSG
jgi:hypothetical protein